MLDARTGTGAMVAMPLAAALKLVLSIGDLVRALRLPPLSSALFLTADLTAAAIAAAAAAAALLAALVVVSPWG